MCTFHFLNLVEPHSSELISSCVVGFIHPVNTFLLISDYTGHILLCSQFHMCSVWFSYFLYGPISTIFTTMIRAPVFGRHQFFGTSEHYCKAHGSFYYLDEWIIITLRVAGFIDPAIFQYFHHSSDKSSLKVADCTVQSAEYWCFYGTIFFSLGKENNSNVHGIVAHQ